MNAVALTFLVSTWVATLSIPFTTRIATRLSKVLAEVPEGQSYPPSLHKSVVQARLSHSLDVAVNFPAALLTALAFIGLVTPGLGTILVALIASTLTAISYWLSSPRLFGVYKRYSFASISIPSGLILIANIVGLIVSLIINPK